MKPITTIPIKKRDGTMYILGIGDQMSLLSTRNGQTIIAKQKRVHVHAGNAETVFRKISHIPSFKMANWQHQIVEDLNQNSGAFKSWTSIKIRTKYKNQGRTPVVFRTKICLGALYKE